MERDDGGVVLQYYLAFAWKYRVADKSLAWPGREQATATEDFDVHILSFSILSDDRSKASSKTMPPHSAI